MKIKDRLLQVASHAANGVGEAVNKLEEVHDGADDQFERAKVAIQRSSPYTASKTATKLKVLDMIKVKASASASEPRRIDVNGRFYKRLAEHYLADYLANPSKEAGRAAVDKIGAPFAGPATEGDYWEEVALETWNNQALPEAVRFLRPKLPATVASATDVLSLKNRAFLPYIDVPHLVGRGNDDTGKDADVTGGGKNISQLMHWGTGVKYSGVDGDALRELFVAYELWHLEAWDVFGEDPINDLIAEEAGRIMGRQLQNGEITKDNLQQKLDDGFKEARAWVGSLLRQRKRELDEWVTSEEPKKAMIWWNPESMEDVWGPDTLVSMKLAGATDAELMKHPLAARIADIYGLCAEADAWEKTHGKIEHPLFVKNLLDGNFNTVISKVATDKKPNWADMLAAYINAGGQGT